MTVIKIIIALVLLISVTSNANAKETETIIIPQEMLIDPSKGVSKLGAITAVKESYKGEIVSVIKQKKGWMIRFIDRTGSFLFIGVYAETDEEYE